MVDMFFMVAFVEELGFGIKTARLELKVCRLSGDWGDKFTNFDVFSNVSI
jgi:hypothetical protein